MKRAIIAALTLFCMILLPGCSTISGDISDLMTPPKLTAEQQAIENALNNIVGLGKYTLKYPREGTYRSAFVLHNIDGDTEAEAIAFYCPNDENAGTHVMILKKIGGAWKKVTDFSNEGNDVDQIDFGNYYGAGYDDIAIAWTRLSDTDLALGVYTIRGDKYMNEDTFTKMKTTDLTGDGKDDILLLRLDPAAHKASASLVSSVSGRLQVTARTPIDATVSSYAGVYETKVDGKNAVLIDGYKGQHGLVTEVLTYVNNTLQSPLLDATTKAVKKDTLRYVQIPCMDINSDGAYEIPTAVELPGYADKTDYSQKLWLTDWHTFSNGAVSASLFSCVMNTAQGYYFIYPQKWGKNVTVDNSGGDNSWAFRVWDGAKMGDVLFTVQMYAESDWENAKELGNISNKVALCDMNGVIYVAQSNPKASGDAQYIDSNEIRQNFKLIPS